MIAQKARQSGENPDYPREIYFWKYQENFPDWISDNFMISKIEDSKKILKTSVRGDGVVLYPLQYSPIVLKSGDYVIWDGTKISSITEKRFNLLYEEIKK